jgi:hypothetical protein
MDGIAFGTRFGDAVPWDLGELRRRLGGGLRGMLREKRWFSAGVVHPRFFLGMAVIRVGPLSSAFAYVFDRETRGLFAHNLIGAPVQCRLDADPLGGRAGFRALRGRLGFGPRLAGGDREVTAALLFPGSSLEVRLTFLDGDPPRPALHMLHPMPGGAFAYTRKLAGIPVRGSVRWPGRIVRLEPGEAYAMLDWTLGYHARETFWNWAAGTGRTEDGRLIGFNFSGGVYGDSGEENAVWIDGRPRSVGPVRFEYDAREPLQPWRVRGGGVELAFSPEGLRRADQNYLLVASKFVQPFGCFSGRIELEGDTVLLEGVGGVVEEHFARW